MFLPAGIAFAFAFAFAFVILLTAPALAYDDPLIDSYRSPSPAFHKQVISLARNAVKSYVSRGHHPAAPQGLDPLLQKPSGVFVTITKNGVVRGCMGTLHPGQDSAADEVIRSAIMAASVDPWNKPVTPAELPELRYTVTFSGVLQRVESEDQINTAREGIFVRRGQRGALLLPGEALTSQWALYRCKHKAGIPQDAPVEIYRFQTASFSGN